MKLLIKTLPVLLFASLSHSETLYDNYPNKFGYDLTKSQIQSLSNGSVEIELCSYRSCQWIKFESSNSSWFFGDNQIDFNEFYKLFLTAKNDETFLFSLDKKEKEVITARITDKSNAE